MTSAPPVAASLQHADRLSFWTRVAAFLCLLAACWHGSGYTTKMDEGETGWKVFYGLYLLATLWVLWRPSKNQPERLWRWCWFDCIACTYTFVPLMQLSIQAPRPQWTSLPHLNGFPSGHMVSSFALAWVVSQAYPRLGPLWFAGSILVGWARLVTQDHFVYQIVAGAILGALLAWWNTNHTKGFLLPRVWDWWQLRRYQSTLPGEN